MTNEVAQAIEIFKSERARLQTQMNDSLRRIQECRRAILRSKIQGKKDLPYLLGEKVAEMKAHCAAFTELCSLEEALAS